jgi:hypothetical protein
LTSDTMVFAAFAISRKVAAASCMVRERCEAEGCISREGDMLAALRDIDVSQRRRDIHVDRMKFESQFARLRGRI